MHIISRSSKDSTLEFEKRRNVPVRYNRELVQQTLKAMDRIAEIRQRREAAFYKARMLRAKGGSNAQVQRKRDRAEVARATHLAPAIRAERQARETEAARRELIRVKVLEKRQRAKKSALVPSSGAGMSMDMSA
jgi:large subunit ribosomal protein L24e